MTENQAKRMDTLIWTLNDACRQYYSGQDESPMSDLAYDALYHELELLEKATGVQKATSPTRRVGFEEEGSDKHPHSKPILSLKDTKSVDDLLYLLGEREGVLSWKLDGVGVVLYYVNGLLVTALTRGDGHIGKVIFDNAVKMRGVPTKINHNGFLVVRGEGCISFKDFEQIKRTQAGEKYKNPRNLAAGIVNTTTSSNILLRHVSFIAHSIVESEGVAFETRTEQFHHLENLGFHVVPHTSVLNFELKREVERYTNNISDFEFPVDGLVLTLNNIQYGDHLGSTAKFPRHSLAFKWPDEFTETKVRGMRWSVSRTGLITPVALLAPVSLEGTTVKQANLHNLKFFEGLSIGVGDTVRIYKANKIVPEIEENLTRSGTERYPRECPVCGHSTNVVETPKTRKLYCYHCRGKDYSQE